MSEQEKALVRLTLFIEEQRRHWKRIKLGIIPERKVIQSWIDSCDFAAEDLDEFREKRDE